MGFFFMVVIVLESNLLQTPGYPNSPPPQHTVWVWRSFCGFLGKGIGWTDAIWPYWLL